MACETCLWELFWLAWSSVLIYTFTKEYCFSLSLCLRLEPIFLSLGNVASLFVTSKRHKWYHLDTSWWLLFCSWIICPLSGDHLRLTTTAFMGPTAPALTCTLEVLYWCDPLKAAWLVVGFMNISFYLHMASLMLMSVGLFSLHKGNKNKKLRFLLATPCFLLTVSSGYPGPASWLSVRVSLCYPSLSSL